MKKQFRYIALILSVVLILGGCASDSKKEETTATTQAESVEKEKVKKTTSSLTVDKAETVYVKADANGNKKEVNVEEILKASKDGKDIVDSSILEDIKNTKGDEEFTKAEDGTLIWENNGEDIEYKGTTTEEPPIRVKVTYYLDGKKIAPKSLAGKSGKVKIRFDYKNDTKETVKIDSKEIRAKVPFTVISMMYLSEDVFSNVKVKNGKVLNMGGENIVVGYAFPGLKDSLKLADYEPTKDVKIPSYVEVSADVEDFSLDFTATVASPRLFADLDVKDLEDVDDLTDSMKKLKDAINKLADGADSLLEGMESMQKYMGQYVDGVDSLTSGIASLQSGLGQLDSNKASLLSGAKSLQKGLEQVASSSENLEKQVSTALEEALSDTSLSEKEKQAIYKKVASSLGSSSSSAGLDQLVIGSKQLTSGIESFNSGISKVYSGSKTLNAGASKLKTAGSSLEDGMKKLVKGMKSLKDGVDTFDEKGMDKLSDLAGDDLKDVIVRVKALQKIDKNYKNFGGIADGKKGSVKFIIETEKIKIN